MARLMKELRQASPRLKAGFIPRFGDQKASMRYDAVLIRQARTACATAAPTPQTRCGNVTYDCGFSSGFPF
jgi:hypothetical protein